MADAVVTRIAREKLVKARAGVIELPPIAGMAFGTGGVDSEGTPIVPSVNDEGLKAEVFRKKVDSYIFTDDTTCRYFCTLMANECADENINEIGLYDSDGDIIAIKTFKSKGKDADIEMTFRIDDIF
nr:phage tail protein [uncultured Acetatifactor sp.]